MGWRSTAEAGRAAGPHELHLFEEVIAPQPTADGRTTRYLLTTPAMGARSTAEAAPAMAGRRGTGKGRGRMSGSTGAGPGADAARSQDTC